MNDNNNEEYFYADDTRYKKIDTPLNSNNLYYSQKESGCLSMVRNIVIWSTLIISTLYILAQLLIWISRYTPFLEL